MTKNVQRRIKELPECQKAEDITGESSYPMACYHISKMLPTIDHGFNSQPHS
jgi:hypothetical protein